MFRRPILCLLAVAFALAACGSGSAAQPKAGATLSGPIKMDKAKTATLTLKVSSDGSSIVEMSAAFEELKCEGFSAGSVTSKDHSNHPVNDGKLEIKSSSLGKVTGQFTSATEANGSIELTINPGIGSPIPCGTWDWSATEE
jgi:hypothetical protein